MRFSTRWTWIPGIVTAWLLAAGSASAALTPEVKDDAGIFKKETIKQANEEIKQLKDLYKKDLLIETYKEIPADKKASYSEESKNRFFQQWALERAKSAGVNGVYVMICMSPPHLQVEVGHETQKKAFTTEDRDELVKRLQAKFKSKEYDRGLLDAVNFVESKMSAHLGRASAQRGDDNSRAVPPNSSGGGHANAGGTGMGIGGWICLGVVGLAAVWLVFGLIRAFTGMGAGYGGGGGYGPGYGGGYGGGGGGFMSGLIGGMFGAAAGNWMYDSFFRGHGGGMGSSAYGAD